MYPILLTFAGVPVTAYGVSKLVAVLVATILLVRIRRHGLPVDVACTLVTSVTIWGFVGAKLYYLVEHARDLSWHLLGGSGFTWYGGFLGGALAALVVIRRHGLPLGLVSGVSAVPLSVAYGLGRLGCLLAGDGTYGLPTDLPWGVVFDRGTVPTMVPVHPTPLYEALAAFAIAGVLAWWGRRVAPVPIFGAYLVLSGTARLLVEQLRINDRVLFGLTQPQLWSLVLLVLGLALLSRAQGLPTSRAATAHGASGVRTATT